MKKYLLVLAAAIAIATGSWYAYAAHSRNMPLLPSQAPAAATANLASAQDLPRLQVQNLVQYIPPDSATSRTFSWQVEPGMTGPWSLEYRPTGTKPVASVSAQTTTVPAYKDNELPQTMYAAYVTELRPATTYEYRLTNQVKATAWQQFTTTTAGLNHYKVLVFGDAQSANYNVWGQTAVNAFQKNPDASFFIGMGDNVDNGQDLWQWRAWFENARPLLAKLPWAPVLGNHEAYSLDWKVAKPETFPAIVAVPENGPANQKRLAYSFNYGDVHFVALNTTWQETRKWYPDLITEEAEWLRHDLAAAREAHQRIIVLMHRNLWEYPFNGPYDPHGKAFGPLFDQYNVELVFTAHVHSYSRTQPYKNGHAAASGAVHISTGRSGEKTWPGSIRKTWDAAFYNPVDSPMYVVLEVEPQDFKVTAYKQDGTEIDTATIPTKKY